MSEITFRETVRHIEKLADDSKYEITFRRRAAYYWLAVDQEESLAALHASAHNKEPVIIVADSLSAEIISARPAT